MKLLIKWLVKDYKNIENSKVREMYGKISSITGIVLNLILFAGKFIVGMLFHSVSIQADAFNNLSDAGSSLISLISFVFSNRPADEEHPFGHERFEYVCSLVVSFLILLFSFELVTSSIDAILHPSAMHFDYVMILVLVVSMLVKLYMYSYNTHYGNMIHSSVMKATALDSISDVMATGAILIALLISKWSGWNLDGIMGIFVALVIAKAGIEMIKETLDKLMGEAPDQEFTDKVVEKVLSYEGVLGIHDMVVHAYGSKKFVSLHAEVDANADVLVSHDLMDNIERDFKCNENIELVLHMDPIVTDDDFTNELREKVRLMLAEIDERLTFHDFRVVKGNTHNNLIFDVVVPFNFTYKEDELLEEIKNKLPQNEDGIVNLVVVTFDRAYVSNVTKK